MPVEHLLTQLLQDPLGSFPIVVIGIFKWPLKLPKQLVSYINMSLECLLINMPLEAYLHVL